MSRYLSLQDQEDPEWPSLCAKWRRRLLTGIWAHFCNDWDGLPVDETTWEFSSCHCWDSCTCDDCLDGLISAKKAMDDDFDKASAEMETKP